MSSRHRSAALPLAVLCVAVVIYASLYPFTGWRWPNAPVWAFVIAPWPRYWTGADITFNLLGYLPLGALLCIAQVRHGQRVRWAAVQAISVSTALSLTMETLQNFLPHRVPSNVDWMLNAVGSACGALLVLVALAVGGVQRWQNWRDRWLVPRSAGGVALLLLWPFGLLFPLPLPLAGGQVLDRLLRMMAELLEGTHAAAWWAPSFATPELPVPLLPSTTLVVVVLGQLLPCLVMYAVVLPGWRRLFMALGAAALGFATTTLSTALNFGPEHALTWLTPLVCVALLVGVALALPLSLLSARAAAALGLMVAAALVALVNQAPPNPYFAESLQAWEQGRFIHFHGAAQWVGWLWPYAAMVHLWTLAVSRVPHE